MKVYIIAILYSVLPATAIGEENYVFPKVMQGVWDVSVESCNKQWSDSRITIEKGFVNYWESQGEITFIATDSEGEFSVELSMVGEGERWLDSAVFAIEDDGNSLTEYFDTGVSFKRVRCVGT